MKINKEKLKLSDWIKSLPTIPNYPWYNKQFERIQFNIGGTVLGWINIQYLFWAGDDWRRLYEKFKQKIENPWFIY